MPRFPNQPAPRGPVLSPDGPDRRRPPTAPGGDVAYPTSGDADRRYVDLSQLAQRDREAAEVGLAINHPGYGGVDLDGDPNLLTWREFLVGGPRVLQAYPQTHGPMMRLQEALLRRHEPLPPTAPVNPLLAYRWARAVAVDIPLERPQPGPASIAGGCCLIKGDGGGTAEALFPMATPSQTQSVDLSSFEMMVVDEQGQPVDCVVRHKIGPLSEAEPEKYVARISFDLDRMPPQAFLRWQVGVTSVDGQRDLSTPLPIPGPSDLSSESKGWLAAAPMIQVHDPEMAALAASIRAGSSTLQELVAQTLAAIAQLRRPTPTTNIEFQNDALSFLRTGIGECTAHANLFAALMRANGVPCRAVTGVQKGTGQNMHYRNEYWAPGAGWIHVEPQGQQIQTPRWEWVETGVVYPSMEQEGRGFMSYDGIHRFSMIGQEVDAHGEPTAPAAQRLQIIPGLVVRSDPNGALAIHGAG